MPLPKALGPLIADNEGSEDLQRYRRGHPSELPVSDPPMIACDVY
jgi:hypothetical protein